MVKLAGRDLVKLVDQSSEWYHIMRGRLIDALEEGGYPYGSVRLSPAEQYIQYRNMTPEDWANMIERLYDRFRGVSDANSRVGDEMARYRGKMEALGRRMGVQEAEVE